MGDIKMVDSRWQNIGTRSAQINASLCIKDVIKLKMIMCENELYDIYELTATHIYIMI